MQFDRVESSARRAAEEKLQSGIEKADQLLEAGDVLGALVAYSGLADTSDGARRAARSRFVVLADELAQLAEKLPTQIPAAPSIVQTAADRKQAVDQLDTAFTANRKRLVAAIIGAADHEGLQADLAATRTRSALRSGQVV